jgi:hypothetical protein
MDFRKEYYRVMRRIYFAVNAIIERYAEFEKTPEVLDEIIDGERCAARDVFEYGLFLLAYGFAKENVEFVLSNIVETYKDKKRKLLASIQKEAVLYMTDKDNLQLSKIMLRLDSRVHIKNNAVSRACAEYCKDNATRAFEHIDGDAAGIKIRIPCTFKKAINKILTRTLMLNNKIRCEGFKTLQNEIDIESAAVHEILEYGMLLAYAELPAEEIDLILTRCVESEKNPVKKRLKRIEKEAVMSINAGNNPRITIMILLSVSGMLPCINDKKIEELEEQYEVEY